jgi:hypothetical protein
MKMKPSKGQRIRIDLAFLGLAEVSCLGYSDMMKAAKYPVSERHLDLKQAKNGRPESRSEHVL